MVRFGFVAAIAATVTLGLASHASAATVSGVYNTGVSDTGALLADGATDTHYTSSFGNGIVYSNGAYTFAGDARYIAPQSNGAGPSSYTFTTTFNLTGYNPGTAMLTGAFSTDNAGSVFLNGALLATSTDFHVFTSFTAAGGFLMGTNTLTFSMQDFGNPTALSVSGLTVTADRAVVATPGPIAGAGLIPLLGIAGGFFARRRRAALNA